MGGEIIVLEYAEGATPLDLDEVAGLIPAHITTQGQLNEWEQINILEAEKWLHRQKLNTTEILSSDFIKELHRKMFDKTWKWAGQFRKTDKNIGVDWSVIAVSLRVLLDDIYYQLENHSYSIIELAARFHHRLVSIHPFANGNGRHSRMMTDVLLLSQDYKRFSWGSAQNLVEKSPVRKQYIDALRAADKMNYAFLLDFVTT